ncbi:hapless 2-like [Schistocerca piceifrons]|uniref:hapless 2-like n=1 Tax=Schistocerca piceifrons TaxID=274613 RepID=UPI001F5F76FD|nr:hapless 2-like [Schistocerca piceifrons]
MGVWWVWEFCSAPWEDGGAAAPGARRVRGRYPAAWLLSESENLPEQFKRVPAEAAGLDASGGGRSCNWDRLSTWGHQPPARRLPTGPAGANYTSLCGLLASWGDGHGHHRSASESSSSQLAALRGNKVPGLPRHFFSFCGTAPASAFASAGTRPGRVHARPPADRWMRGRKDAPFLGAKTSPQPTPGLITSGRGARQRAMGPSGGAGHSHPPPSHAIPSSVSAAQGSTRDGLSFPGERGGTRRDWTAAPRRGRTGGGGAAGGGGGGGSWQLVRAAFEAPNRVTGRRHAAADVTRRRLAATGGGGGDARGSQLRLCRGSQHLPAWRNAAAPPG